MKQEDIQEGRRLLQRANATNTTSDHYDFALWAKKHNSELLRLAEIGLRVGQVATNETLCVHGDCQERSAAFGHCVIHQHTIEARAASIVSPHAPHGAPLCPHCGRAQGIDSESCAANGTSPTALELRRCAERSAK